MHNRLDPQYKELIEHILHFGVEKKDRTGTGTKSIFGWQIRHNMKDGFPLLTTKKMAWKQIVTELLWFLRGDTNIKYLVDNGCNIWNGDAMKNYEKQNGEIDWGPFISKEEAFLESMKDDEFAKEWGELGPIYGAQWRKWSGTSYIPCPTPYNETTEQKWHRMGINSVALKQIDQIQNLINELKTNPDSRRLMVNAWNVADLPVTDYRTDDELYQDYLKQNS